MIGTETVLLTESHLTLRRVNNPDLPFAKAYSYGKSTKNQRIEAWWNILTEGQTQEWKVYFAKLEAEGYYDGGETDKSCLQYLYMDMICSHIHRFIEVHNSHPIRLQRNRQHYLPTGQPFLLYYYPEDGKDYKEKVDEKVLAELEKEVAEYDLDEYLPASTMKLYGEILEAGGYPRYFAYNDLRHEKAYLYLRDQVSRHIAFGGQVQLASRPSGAAEWILNHTTQEIEAHRGGIIGISGDCTMQLMPTDDEEEEDKAEGNPAAKVTNSNVFESPIPATSSSDYINNTHDSVLDSSNSKY